MNGRTVFVDDGFGFQQAELSTATRFDKFDSLDPLP
jgi:hypothetical protein